MIKWITIFVLLPSLAFAGHIHKEKEYQEAWCKKINGITEYRLEDGARVDCLTDQFAIEFDFAPKWAESIGQALYYAEMTGRKPGVVLIQENDDDDRYMDRLKKVAGRHGIKVWEMTPDEL
ncbi:MAG: hypothetical protein M0T70_02735 [Geobacteraceae bacterium]|nr:hypothetical protein [Geobacteraceae bacterium]